ncbi:MAG: MFS transporter [Bacteroidia bacterium]|nr:MFS transporter [Bacteroidia bacterium]
MYSYRLVFAVACVSMLLFGVVMLTIGSTLPEIIAKFQVNEADAGILLSILPLGVLGGSLSFGPMTDRYGHKKLLVVCALMVMAGLEGIAFAPSWGWIIASAFLIGLGGGALNGAANGLVADISTHEKGAKLGLLGSFYGFGALGMPLLFALLSGHFTNEMILSGVGFLILGIVIFMLTIQFPPSKQSEKFPVAESLKLMRNPLLLLMGLLLFFESGQEGLVLNWANIYLQENLGFDTDPALFALTIHVAALTAGRLLLGALLRLYGSFTVLMWSMGIVLAGGLIFMVASSYAVSVLALFLLGAGFAGVFPITMGKIGEIWSSLSGTAFSITLVIALGGNMMVNYLMGILSHKIGLTILPTAILICLLLMMSIFAIVFKMLNDRKLLNE